jgi:hypothetical protein
MWLAEICLRRKKNVSSVDQSRPHGPIHKVEIWRVKGVNKKISKNIFLTLIIKILSILTFREFIFYYVYLYFYVLQLFQNTACTIYITQVILY